MAQYKVGENVYVPMDFGVTAAEVLQVRSQDSGRKFSYVVELLGMAVTLHVKQADLLHEAYPF